MATEDYFLAIWLAGFLALMAALVAIYGGLCDVRGHEEILSELPTDDPMAQLRDTGRRAFSMQEM